MSNYITRIVKKKPLSYWRLGEASAASPAADEMFRYDGTYVGTPTVGVTGALVDDINTAISLNGTNQRVNMGDVLDFTHTDPFSISIWFKAILTSTGALVAKRLHSGNFTGYSLEMVTAGNIYVTLFNTNVNRIVVHTTASGFDDDVWHCVTATYDGSQTAAGVNIYVDGVNQTLIVDNNNLSASITTTAPLNIGARNNTDLHFGGELDEPAIFGYELTAEDAAEIYYAGIGDVNYALDILSYNPTCYLRLGETSGTTAVDETVNGFDGVYAPAFPTAATGLLIGDFDGAISFDGSTQYVTIDSLSGAGLTNGQALTICFWFSSLDSTSGLDVIFSAHNTSDVDRFKCGINNTTVGTLATISMADPAAEFGSGLNDGNPHFISLVFTTSTNLDVYIDGIYAGTDTISSVTWSDCTKFSLAQEWDPTATASNFFTGAIDEFTIIERALTAYEVRIIYACGLGLFFSDLYNAVAANIGFKAYWRLGEAAGTDAFDVFGNFNGTYINAPTLGVTGALEKDNDTAVTFIASSLERVDMGDVLDFTHTDAFSLSIWFKTAAVVNTALLTKRLQLGNLTGYSLELNTSGAIQVFLTNTGTTNEIQVHTTTTGFNDDVWHNVTVTYDGSQTAAGISIYVDGVNEAITTDTDNLSATITTTASFNLGARNNSDLFLDGELDEAIVFDKELTAAEARRLNYRGRGYTKYELAVMERDSIAYWQMNEVSGTVIDELLQYNGTAQGAPTYGATGLLNSNPPNNAMSFLRASSQYVSVDVTDVVSKKVNSTVSALIHMTDAPSNGHTIWHEETGSNVAFSLYVDASGFLHFLVRNTSTDNSATDTAALVINRTYHVTAVLDSVAGMSIFVNGLPVATNANTSPTDETVTAAQMGARLLATAVYINGSLDEVALMQESLTDAEVEDLYAHTIAAFFEQHFDLLVKDLAAFVTVAGSPVFQLTQDALGFNEIIEFTLGKLITETLGFQSGPGQIAFLTDSLGTTDTSSLLWKQYEVLLETLASSASEALIVAKKLVESLLASDTAGVTYSAGVLIAEELTLADLLSLAILVAGSDTLTLSDVNSDVFVQNVAIIAEILTLSGVALTQHTAVAVATAALILQSSVSHAYNPLTSTESLGFTGTPETFYRAITAEVEALSLSDSLLSSFSLVVTDSLDGDDTLTINQALCLLVEDTIFIGGTLQLEDGVYSAVVVNSQTLGISEYTNYPFHSFGKIGSTYLGATDTAIYALTGTDDAGTEIDSVLRTGMMSFGTNLFKRVPRAYLGYTSSGGLIMKVISTSGGTKTERWYELTPRTVDHASTAHAAARIKLGRGVKATYWQFELINKAGSDFDVDTLQLYPMVLRRRV